MNLKIKEITVFECTDGKQFNNRQEAEAHQRMIDLTEEMVNDRDLDWYEMTAETVAQWILDRYELTPKDES